MKWICLKEGTIIGAVAEKGVRPLNQDMVRSTSNKYRGWQGEAMEGSLSVRTQKMRDRLRWIDEALEPPMVPKPQYNTPKGILRRNEPLTMVMDDCRSNSKNECVVQDIRTPPQDPQPLSSEVDYGTQGVQASLQDPQLPSNGQSDSERAIFAYHANDCHVGLCAPSIFLASSLPQEVDQSQLPPEIVVKEGVDMSTEEMQHQLAYIPEISKDVEPFDISKLDVGEAGMSMNDKTKMLDVLGKFPKFFISSGNGLPPPARGAVYDIDVGSAKPIAGRARRVRVEYLGKLFELLKGLMQFGLIQFSKSKWASPIVILYEITEDQFASGQVSDAAKETFDDLKLAYASTPILKHANPELAYHVLIYTTDWAISATLCQEYDGILHPVRFCGRVLKGSEPKQPMWAKEILALLRVIDVCYYELAGKQLNVYTQHDAGKWIVKDKFGRTEHLHWAIMLAPWTITFIPVEQLDGKWNMPILLAEQLTPPGQFLSEVFEPLRPNKAKGITERVDTPIPLFTSTEETYVITFDGAIKLSLRA
ncbi:hypothetical protein LEN26_013286, partial [Aphanomyces euteiches]